MNQLYKRALLSDHSDKIDLSLDLKTSGPGEFGMGLYMDDNNSILRVHKHGSVAKCNPRVNLHYRMQGINGTEFEDGQKATHVLRDLEKKGHTHVIATFEKIGSHC